jgi:hypothetical protein
MYKPEIVNREKASSHPAKPGQLHYGVVESVDKSGRVNVNVRSMNATFGPISALWTTPLNRMKRGDVVICGFTDDHFNELVVFGPSKIKEDVFAEKKVVDDLILRVQALEAIVSSLGAQAAALESRAAALEAE